MPFKIPDIFWKKTNHIALQEFTIVIWCCYKILHYVYKKAVNSESQIILYNKYYFGKIVIIVGFTIPIFYAFYYSTFIYSYSSYAVYTDNWIKYMIIYVSLRLSSFLISNISLIRAVRYVYIFKSIMVIFVKTIDKRGIWHGTKLT